ANLVATVTSPSSVSLSWTASTEPGGSIASYQISRNNASLASVAGSANSFADTTAAPGGTYSYSVTALDGGGSPSDPATSNTVTTPLMSTGFEGGTLADWNRVVGQVAVQSGTVHAGTYAAALASTGGQTFALQNLPAAGPALFASVWVNVNSQSTPA